MLAGLWLNHGGHNQQGERHHGAVDLTREHNHPPSAVHVCVEDFVIAMGAVQTSEVTSYSAAGNGSGQHPKMKALSH
jgi:hypothetical protein